MMIQKNLLEVFEKINKQQIVAIVSPPYEEQTHAIGWSDEYRQKFIRIAEKKHGKGRLHGQSGQQHISGEYSKNHDNIGNLKTEHNQELNFDIIQYNKCGGELYWYGCYDSDIHYKQYFEPSTYAHPAKISPLLTERIFRHLKHLGLLKEGMTILDFMAGSGRVPLLASLKGYKSIGVELEPHFCKMCNDNKKFAENKIGRKLDMKIIQGDSRQLSKLLKSSDVGIVSPPFEQNLNSNTGIWNKGLKRHIPFPHDSTKNQYYKGYGDNPDNIGNLPYKEMVGVVSPPFLNSNTQGKGNKIYLESGLKYRSNKLKHKNVKESAKFDGYSQNPNNIGNLKDKGFVGITSPPYENQTLTQDKEFIKKIENEHRKGSRFQGGNLDGYGINEQNLGNQQGENYLSEMLKVYKEASKVCPVICTVTKNPTRQGKLRRLDLDTAKLLELSGYRIIDYHRTVLFKTHGQATLTGETKKGYKGRLSFFKRLSLAKGNKAAEFEDILIGVSKI